MTKKIQITLAKELYDVSSILQAANDFSEHFLVDVSENASHVLVSLEPKQSAQINTSRDMLDFEFSNYVLGLMQS